MREWSIQLFNTPCDMNPKYLLKENATCVGPPHPSEKDIFSFTVYRSIYNIFTQCFTSEIIIL